VSVVVETVDDRRAVDIDHYGQYATLNGADRLCSVSLLDIPSATEFNQATIKSTDLWELETRDLKKRLEGKVVVIGDQYTDTSRPVDQHARPGQTRDIWGVELQATFVQACIDTIKLKVGFTSDVSESVANFGMPLATLTGIGFGWWLVRRLPVAGTGRGGRGGPDFLRRRPHVARGTDVDLESVSDARFIRSCGGRECPFAMASGMTRVTGCTQGRNNGGLQSPMSESVR
jgi:hypothetical protein